MVKTSSIVLLLLISFSCSNTKQTIELQGHRGCRGLYPENTIDGFLHALEIGVTTLEMDLVISKDKQVVVSHEPYFSHEIATSPEGELISKETETEHNIYELTYDQLLQYDVGLRVHPRFPEQKKIAAVKPLLKDVIDTCEKYAAIHNSKKPLYNIEIKRVPENDSLFHPSVSEFVDLVIEQVKSFSFSERVCLQSFDSETLQIIKQKYPEMIISLLVENEESIEQNVQKLGFTPDIYSPYFELITEDVMRYCRTNNIQIIPWTVNEENDMLRMIELNVDGIITDYPNRLKKMLDDRKIKVK